MLIVMDNKIKVECLTAGPLFNIFKMLASKSFFVFLIYNFLRKESTVFSISVFANLMPFMTDLFLLILK